MRFRGLDLNLLVALDALMTTRNVTRASEQLNLSQAATSNALARLRRYFGDDLLVRVGRRMVLTDRARALQRELEDILRQIETRVIAAPTTDLAGQRRQIRVMSADAIAIDLLARVSERLARDAPGIQLLIRPPGINPDQSIDRGETDLLLIPRQFASADHPMETIYEEPFAVIACRDGVWRDRPVTAEAYLAAQHVIVEIGPERKVPVDRAIIEQAHGQLHAGVLVASQALVPWYVNGTDRLGTIPAGVAKRFEALLPLVSHLLPFEVPPNQIVMQWNTQRDHDTGLAHLRAVFHEVFSAY